MFVIHPDPYSLPCYRIGPFQTKDLVRNHKLMDNGLIDSYLQHRFSDRDFIFTENGRKAISLAMGELMLNREDVVTILTTSGNFYISGCVTAEIEKFCKWSRNFEPNTKAIFVNHEFGYPYEPLKDLKKYGLPIIEDCANTFFSVDANGETGRVGDFVIYSFPKSFPLQVGGLLVAKDLSEVSKKYHIHPQWLDHIKAVLSNSIGQKDEMISKRIQNYQYLKSEFAKLGFQERFPLNEGIVPGVFMFRTQGQSVDLSELKKHYWSHGVQCSVFYGEESFFIPVHHSLDLGDLDYFIEVFKSFLTKSN